jgi:LmbE family N-acetylglucosaminyl deacetylase
LITEADEERSTNLKEPLRLMSILAHPDDESMGTGGILAKYAAEGVETYLVTATRGERGWWGEEADYPGPEAVGSMREQELQAAAQVLGLQEVNLLGYLDKELDQADPDEVIGKLVTHLRRVRPQVVVSFGPYGYYGHPDHIAISQFTTAAVVAAADPAYNGHQVDSPHRVDKLYYLAATREEQEVYQTAFGELDTTVDGQEREATPWPDWAITTQIDTSRCWETIWQAIACHRSQLPGYQSLLDLPQEYHRRLWGMQTFYRAYSLANGGRGIEADLFDGLR